MKYPYNAHYQPPFPMLNIVLVNNEENLRTIPQIALIDSGADGSFVPLFFLQEILAPPVTNTHVRSHWGEWRPVQLFLVDLEIGSQRWPNIFVIGDEQGDEIILGRNILNKLRLTLDGPAQMTRLL